MASAAKPAVIESHVAEVVEVAQSILRRHRDEHLAKKTFVMQGYLAISRSYPERDYSEWLNAALVDLTAAIHLHLNAEVAAIATMFRRLRGTSEAEEASL